jgi:serine protease Do
MNSGSPGSIGPDAELQQPVFQGGGPLRRLLIAALLLPLVACIPLTASDDPAPSGATPTPVSSASDGSTAALNTRTSADGEPPEGVSNTPTTGSTVPGAAAPVVPVPGAPVTFADLVEQVRPGVVNIFTEQLRPTGRMIVQGMHYGRPYGVPEERIERSLGSGFIIDAQGHVLTNTHVIADATAVRVQLLDGRALEADVIGVDPATDLAVIRIQPFEGMTTLPLGDSDAVRVGDWLMAVGNPFGLSSTVTAGILSARGRRDVPLGGSLRYVDFLQTDASINPGNSGGPLLNMQGEVIGINTAVNREGQGIGFAIPSNMARQLLPSLVESGRVSRSWLGVYIDAVDPRRAAALGLPRQEGAMVADVVPGGPAALSGIQPGEVIVSFNGQPIQNAEDLLWIASTAGVGQRVPIEVAGADGRRMVHTTLGELPE